jgi:hypothetical protein
VYVNNPGSRAAHLGDFTLTSRTLLITAAALVIGGGTGTDEHGRRDGAGGRPPLPAKRPGDRPAAGPLAGPAGRS